MAGFCTQCGLPYDQDKVCPNGHRQRASVLPPDPPPGDLPVPPDTLGPFPPPKTRKRLLGSGVEYGVYMTMLSGLWLASVFTLGLLDMVFVPILLLLIGLRDANAGLFSVAKRIGKMRVVEHGTGQPATNRQAMIRNGYYLALTFVMFFPIIITDFVAYLLFILLVAIDAFMISTSREGRRIGDHLANTQVVREADPS